MDNSSNNHNQDLYWLWFSLLPVIPHKIKSKILYYFGNVADIWNADKYELKQKVNLDNVSIKIITERKNRDKAKSIYENLKNSSIILLHPDQPEYPEGLKTIDDKPFVLYCKGIPKKGEKAISIIGSRKASSYGLAAAATLAGQLAAFGLTIVSGMAKGVDSAAHKAAMDAGGRTVAILGNGIDIVYPSENSGLFDRITENGMVITEFPPGTLPYDYNFPMRNRLISGYSLGTVVVEAAQKSGTMITVNHAQAQGRTVFAVPGSIFSVNSTGTNKLIYDGAVAVTGIADILEELDLVQKSSNGKEDNNHGILEYKDFIKKRLPGGEYIKVIEAITNGTTYVDGICRATGLSAEITGRILTELEIMGHLVRHGGHYMINFNRIRNK